MISLNIEKRLKGEAGSMHLRICTDIPQGELVALYGSSGAGKTSTLRMLAGLMKPDSGRISFSGTPWFDSERKINRKPGKRNIGYVFQDFALFPNMTVKENLKYAQKKTARNNLLSRVLDMVELGDLANQKPNTLSGGQKQRVALARALVQEPEILLLDEPLTALDPKMRLKLQEHLLLVHREFKLTTVLVSHSISEITRLSNQVIVLEKGEIIRVGSPSEVWLKHDVSGKFKFVGEVLALEKADLMFVVHVLVQEQSIKVIATAREAQGLRPGDTVIVASKAFNPLIYKLDSI